MVHACEQPTSSIATWLSSCHHPCFFSCAWLCFHASTISVYSSSFSSQLFPSHDSNGMPSAGLLHLTLYLVLLAARILTIRLGESGSSWFALSKRRRLLLILGA